MFATSIGNQIGTFAKIAFDMYRLGWNTGDFSQFTNLLNKVGVKFIDQESEESIDGRAGYKKIVQLIQEKSDQGDRLHLELLDQSQQADRVTFTFNYKGIQNGQTIEGQRKLQLGVRNAKIISYHLTEL